jgi:hypothetical protein
MTARQRKPPLLLQEQEVSVFVSFQSTHRTKSSDLKMKRAGFMSTVMAAAVTMVLLWASECQALTMLPTRSSSMVGSNIMWTTTTRCTKFVLYQTSRDDNDEDKTTASSSSPWDRTIQALEQGKQAVREKLPTPLVNLVQNVGAKLVTWRWQFVSFTAGALLTVGAILVPVYSQVEHLSKPVTLFETILGDLQVAYVDPVDTEKLFETGMNAMLQYVLYTSPNLSNIHISIAHSCIFVIMF